MKEYRLNGLSYVHDGRGCFVKDGEVCVLPEERAQRIIQSAARRGNPDALIEVSELDPQPSVQEATPEDDCCDDSECGAGEALEEGGGDGSFSVFEVTSVLSLSANERKKIAAKLSGKKVTTAAKADTIIKKAEKSDLWELMQEPEEG